MPGDTDKKNDFKLLWGTWQLSDLIANGPLGSIFQAVRKDKGGDQQSIVRIIALTDEAKAEKIAKNARDMIELGMKTGLVGYEDYLVVEENKQWYVILRMEKLDPMPPFFANKPFSVEEVARLGIEICAGLDQTSKKGIVHGDIKESDLFVDKSGGFKLSDFFLARELLGPKGDAEYPTHIAPEIIKGEKYDVRADIYSLGLVLYRLLNNGREPFYPLYTELITPEKEAAAFDRRMKGDEPPTPVIGGHDIGLAVLKALSYNPQDRYQTPLEFSVLLQTITRPNAVVQNISENRPQIKPLTQRESFAPFAESDVPVKMEIPVKSKFIDDDADIPMEKGYEKDVAPLNFNFGDESKNRGLKLPRIDILERFKEKRTHSNYKGGAKHAPRTKVRHRRRRNRLDLLVGAIMIVVVIVAVALWRGSLGGKQAQNTPTPNPAATQAPIVTPSVEPSVSALAVEAVDHQNARVALTWLPDSKDGEVAVFYRYKGGQEKQVTAASGTNAELTGLLPATEYEVRVEAKGEAEDLKETFTTSAAPLCDMPGYKTTSVKFFEGPPYSEDWDAQKLADLNKSYEITFQSGKRRLFVTIDNNWKATETEKKILKSIIVRAPDGSIAYYLDPQEVTVAADKETDHNYEVICYDGYEWLTGEYKFERYYDGTLAGKGKFTIE